MWLFWFWADRTNMWPPYYRETIALTLIITKKELNYLWSWTGNHDSMTSLEQKGYHAHWIPIHPLLFLVHSKISPPPGCISTLGPSENSGVIGILSLTTNVYNYSFEAGTALVRAFQQNWEGILFLTLLRTHSYAWFLTSWCQHQFSRKCCGEASWPSPWPPQAISRSWMQFPGLCAWVPHWEDNGGRSGCPELALSIAISREQILFQLLDWDWVFPWPRKSSTRLGSLAGQNFRNLFLTSSVILVWYTSVHHSTKISM